jgi:hypothetical protein
VLKRASSGFFRDGQARLLRVLGRAQLPFGVRDEQRALFCACPKHHFWQEKARS